jgi:hypothetical protein
MRGVDVMNRLFFLCLRHVTGAIAGLTLLSGLVMAEEVSVQAVGIGMSREEAISSALVSAVEQVAGVKIDAKSALRIDMNSISTTGEESVELSEKQQREVVRSINGIIKRYDIVQIGLENDSRISATLAVTIERYASPGLPTQDRRRIYAIPPIDLTRKSAESVVFFKDKLTAYLVQSRRFAVVDRENDQVFQKEMAVLRSDDVPLSETVRIGQVIGADYIVIPKLRKLEQRDTRILMPVTNETIIKRIAVMTLDYTLVDVATKQIKWTGSFDKQKVGSLEEIVLQSANDIGESILNSIFPLRVVQITEQGIVVINQGGDTLRAGQRLGMFRLGEEMIDPYTKEPIGRVETPVAQISVERVDPKMSYAKVMSGDVRVDGDYILRKELAEPQVGNVKPVSKARDPIKW